MGAIGGLGAVGLGMLRAISSLSSLGGVEIGPGQGTRSERLEVEVKPRAGLDDGATVFVTSDAFEARSVVGVAVCLDEADTERGGVEACDEAHGTRFAVDRRGRLSAAVAVSRVITVGGRAHYRAEVEVPRRVRPYSKEDPVRCDSSPGRCGVVIAAAADVRRSSFSPLTLAR